MNSGTLLYLDHLPSGPRYLKSMRTEGRALHIKLLTSLADGRVLTNWDADLESKGSVMSTDELSSFCHDNVIRIWTQIRAVPIDVFYARA